MAKTAYVTGSTGFLGLNIVKELKSQGWEVLALRRTTSDTSDLDKMNATQVIGDITDIESLRKTMPEGVDAVFNVAADTSLWKPANVRQNKINIEGTRNVVQVALEKKVGRFIHTSSIGAFGNIYDKPLQEEDIKRAAALQSNINYYRSKYLAEQEVHKGIEKGLDAVILNPAQIIGPHDHNYTPLIINIMRAGNLYAAPSGGTVAGHSRDYAKAHIAAFEKGRTGENYLLGGVEISQLEMVATVGEVLGVKAPQTTVPPIVFTVLGWILEKISYITKKEPTITPESARLMNAIIHIDSSKAERELGFSTCSVREMYEDAYRWMQEVGLDKFK